MTVSDFSMKIVLLFLPGIVSFIIIDNLSNHRQTKTIHWFMYSMLLGFASYAILKVMWPTIHFWEFLITRDPISNYDEIILAIIVGILLGCLLTCAINHSFFFTLCSALQLTTRQGTPDTFSYMMSLYKFKYLTVTDWEKRIQIVGELTAVSESTDNRDEIILQNATVYSLDHGYKLYDIDVIYIAQDFSKLSIEIANTKASEGGTDNGTPHTTE